MSTKITVTVSLGASMLHVKITRRHFQKRSSLKKKVFKCVGKPKISDFCFVKKKVVD